MQKYDVLTDIEHVLKRPDTYGGSTTEETWYVMVSGEYKPLVINPMLLKIFDEAIVNAADNFTRKSGTTEIRVEVDQAKGVFSIYNNGATVPVVKHDKKDALTGKKIYTPEMVFFRLRAGQNFDDDTKRYEGGRNGIGIKLASIFSVQSKVEIVDKRGRHYVQEYRDNMNTAQKPEIGTSDQSPFTRVTFQIDLSRFMSSDVALTSIPDDVFSLMRRRSIDIAACCEGVKVFFNGQRIQTTFEEYANRQLCDMPLLVSSKKHWSVAVGLTPEDADSKNVSFVNNVWTRDDGHHIDHVRDQVCKVLLDSSAVKKLGLKKSDIQKQLRFVVKSYLVNPTFNSQMKERMTLPIKSFDTQFVVTGPMRKQLLSGPLLERLQDVRDAKDGRKLKKNDGKKVRTMNILKLTDAKKAGTAESSKCTIIFTEGDSALALALAGLSVVDKKYYGAFPLKGKILNGEKASKKQWADNAVIQNVIKILGLKHGHQYTSAKDLRYGHIIIMSDQDVDGFHIRGLVKCIFGSHWPELLTVPGFIQVMKTPLVKAFRGKQFVREFFNETTAAEYQTTHQAMTYKYYKGLGTSTSAEAKEYFRNLNRYVFNMEGDPAWLKRAYAENTTFRKELSAVPPAINDGKTYEDFVRGPFATYIRADNVRKITANEDGLKVVQRKILYTFLKKRYTSEQKVAQMAGIIANFTHYHSGEENIAKAIVKMAQKFIGSNNLPILKDNGQFGTQHAGGKDAAAARYINTELQDWVTLAFRHEDLEVLEYSKIDGKLAEPDVFVPIIPFVLVNGSCGLGTAWVSDIPPHNPVELIHLVRNRINGVITKIPMPWTKDHLGEYFRNDGKLFNKGVWKVEGTTVTISELPVGTWTECVEAILKNPKTKFEFDSIEENHTDVTVSFTIRGVKDIDKLVSALKLIKPVRENYVVFQNKVLIDSTVENILDHHHATRLALYTKRKTHQLASLEASRLDHAAKLKFIEACITGNIPLSTATDQELLIACNEQDVDPKYLDIGLRELTDRKIKELRRSIKSNAQQQSLLTKTSEHDMWLRELGELETKLAGKKKRDFADVV